MTSIYAETDVIPASDEEWELYKQTEEYLRSREEEGSHHIWDDYSHWEQESDAQK